MQSIFLLFLSFWEFFLNISFLQFDPTEPGDYRVEVKWAGDLVPGSPFHVMIFDTEEELRRFVQGM